MLTKFSVRTLRSYSPKIRQRGGEFSELFAEKRSIVSSVEVLLSRLDRITVGSNSPGCVSQFLLRYGTVVQ